MSSKPSSSGVPLANLPDDFFDNSKKSKKVQEDELAKELQQFDKEMAALEAEADQQLKEDFERLQEDKDTDELDQQIKQWKRIVDLEKKAEELRTKTLVENPTKKLRTDKQETALREKEADEVLEENLSLDDIEDFEDKLFDWRSKGL